MTDVDIFGALSISLNGLHDELRAQRENAERVPPQPLERVLTNGAAFPSSGVLALNMGGAQQGRVWRVRSIAVGGKTPTTTEAGRVDVFVATTMDQVLVGPPASGSQPGQGGFVFASALAPGSINAWRDQTATLPGVAFYGFGDLSVHASEQLWIVFSNGTNTDQLTANVRVDDYETAAYALASRA